MVLILIHLLAIGVGVFIGFGGIKYWEEQMDRVDRLIECVSDFLTGELNRKLDRKLQDLKALNRELKTGKISKKEARHRLEEIKNRSISGGANDRS